MLQETTSLNTSAEQLVEELDAVALTASEPISVEEIRKQYAETLVKEPFLDKTWADAIAETPVNEPIFRSYDFHAEDQPRRIDFVEIATDAMIDIASVDSKIIDTTNKYTTLISGTINRLNEVKRRLARAKRRIEDINFICNSYNGMKNVIQIDDSNMSGQFIFNDNTFAAFANTQQEVALSVLNVSGNGYVGNAHVVQDKTYLIDSDDRSNVNYITDASALTVFEYSRICSQLSSGPIIDDVNYDDKEARCTIEVSAKSEFNMFKIESDMAGIKIEDVLISDNGKTYHSALSANTNLTSDMYHNFNYVAGSNIVCFNKTKYAKLILSSDFYRVEDLGYTYTDISSGKPKRYIRALQNAVRKIISIGKLSAYLNTYQDSYMISDNLAPITGLTRVAIFANQYIPETQEYTNREYITYELIVNGTTYKMSPINSGGKYTTLITTDKEQYENSSIVILDEDIRTLQLKVSMHPIGDNLSPFVGNLKICLG